MLKSISWSAFVWFLVVLVLSYYLYVLAFYFRNDFLNFLRNFGNRRGDGRAEYVSEQPVAAQANAQAPAREPAAVAKNAGPDIQLSSIHDLIQELKQIFETAGDRKMVKAELMQAIKSVLQNYPNLKKSDVRVDLDQHIRMECSDRCGIELEKADLASMWAW